MLDGSDALLVAIEMGYGHLRAAYALGGELGLPVANADQAPLADEVERKLWARARRSYEFVSRASQLPVMGGPFDFALGALTAIPGLYPMRDLSAPTWAVRYLARSAKRGLGRGLVEHLGASGRALLTTFYAPAVLADMAGCERVFCVVTDTDVNRVWVPPDVRRSRIQYLVPGHRTARRLQSYGVAKEHILTTGFPLPPELLGGRDLAVLKRNLAARLLRLDPAGTFREVYGDEVDHFLAVPRPTGSAAAPLVTFAVGGAGAQADLPAAFLRGFRGPLEAGRLRLALVAGVRPEVAARFEKTIARNGLGHLVGERLQIVEAPDLGSYFSVFNALLAETDVLWTKPSELTFFGALGLPLLLTAPVGRHEAYNLRWAREAGVGLKQRNPAYVGERLLDWLDDGTLAGAAWSGFMRMPKFGTYKIADAVRRGTATTPPPPRPERRQISLGGVIATDL